MSEGKKYIPCKSGDRLTLIKVSNDFFILEEPEITIESNKEGIVGKVTQKVWTTRTPAASEGDTNNG